MLPLLFVCSLWCGVGLRAGEITSLTAEQRPGTKLVDIDFGIGPPGSESTRVRVCARVGPQEDFEELAPLTGDGADGEALSPGTYRVTWDAGAAQPGRLLEAVTISVIALDDPAWQTSDMVRVEGDRFQMGDTFGDGLEDEIPVHSATVSAFEMCPTEVTNESMAAVMNWALRTGRATVENNFLTNTTGEPRNLLSLDADDIQIGYDGTKLRVLDQREEYPAIYVSWYGAAAYCNFLSEIQGLTPCYDFADWSCDWSASGFRLPTEAEWEWAARGGVSGNKTRYSGANTATEVAWYYATSGAPRNSDLDFGRGTLPVAAKAPNELGLYDMSGNAWEWCNDWYGNYPADPVENPRGPLAGERKIARGGCWFDNAFGCRICYRPPVEPTYFESFIGFRFVRYPQAP